jgi:hypothetical protein
LYEKYCGKIFYHKEISTTQEWRKDNTGLFGAYTTVAGCCFRGKHIKQGQN